MTLFVALFSSICYIFQYWVLVSLIGKPFGGDTRDLGFEFRSPKWEENWIARGPITRIYDL